MDNKRLKNIHKLMKYRCSNPKYDKYKYYGGRGIHVCRDWMKSYDSFETWALEHGYEDGLTLDRINNNKGYCPSNCRWVSRKEQANNRSTNHMLTYKRKKQSLQKWAYEKGLPYKTLVQRIYAGWDIEKALNDKHRTTNHSCYITFNGKTQRIYEWAKEVGLQYNTLKNRISYRGWSVEKALTTPCLKGGIDNE